MSVRRDKRTAWGTEEKQKEEELKLETAKSAPSEAHYTPIPRLLTFSFWAGLLAYPGQ